MIPRECKRLAEVDFPIAEVSRHAAREKSIRHGHPSTLHLWWARRPLASSRAVLLALLLPDPCDAHCPEDFKQQAREILRAVRQPPANDEELRQGLLSFIANFANWKNAADRTHLDVSRALVKAAHGEEPPLVVDPFAGGGSIPLEALRLGCEAFASDVNPVACLILKVLLEDIPRHGPGLAEELRHLGREITHRAVKELAGLYPRDPDGSTPIAYLWARTVRCEAPNCGAEIPLMRSFWLCNKAKRKWALRHRVERYEGEPPCVDFEVFEPTATSEVRGGTVTRAKATCLCCGTVLPPERVRTQLTAERGGADVIFDAEGRRTGGARMTAVVTLQPGQARRHYRLPTDEDYAAVRKAQERIEQVLGEWERDGKQGLCPVPDEPISFNEIRRISVPIYGMCVWGDLFTARQKLALVKLGQLIQKATDYLDTLHLMAALCVDKIAMQNCSGCRWKPTGESLMDTFGRHALGVVWDFAESIPTCGSTGNIDAQMRLIAKSTMQSAENSGLVQPADATDHPLPDQTAAVWFTDPPYYDAIPYAHLSDFFFVWLKRVLPNYLLLNNAIAQESGTTPKEREIVVDRPHRLSSSKKDAAFYEKGMADAFAEGRRVLREDGVGAVVFAHKTTEGWEALLSGMILGGWTITGSWPVTTEMGSRLNARETASLATSVHLICRPRSKNAPVGDWVDVLQELPTRVADWIERLQAEGIRGADLVFACVGPALEIFSRYRAVETAEGNTVELPEYLEKVWEVVGRTALRQILGSEQAGALEEDARLTALFLWTLQTTDTHGENDKPNQGEEEAVAKVAAKAFSLPFDVVRRFAQPMGINLDSWTDRIVGQEKGVVRLLPVTERARKLFGADGAAGVADRIERDPHTDVQQKLFPDLDEHAPPLVRESRPRYGVLSDDHSDRTPGDTTLDRVHTAMLFQSSGHANALRELIGAEQERGPDFLRLANALSALYPRGCNEKRLLDAMLLAVPR